MAHLRSLPVKGKQSVSTQSLTDWSEVAPGRPEWRKAEFSAGEHRQGPVEMGAFVSTLGPTSGVETPWGWGRQEPGHLVPLPLRVSSAGDPGCAELTSVRSEGKGLFNGTGGPGPSGRDAF